MDALARAVQKSEPETPGERLAVALIKLKLPEGTRWRPVGWLAACLRVDRQRVYQYLNDVCTPTVGVWVKIALTLGVSPGWLAFGIPPIVFRLPALGPHGLGRRSAQPAPEIKPRKVHARPRCSVCGSVDHVRHPRSPGAAKSEQAGGRRRGK